MLFSSPVILRFLSAALLLGFCAPAGAETPAAAAPAAAPAVQTVIVDHNLALAVTDIPEACRMLRISMLRRDEVTPSYFSVMRLVREEPQKGRWVLISLSPELFPHAYSPADIWLSCVDKDGEPVGFYVLNRPAYLDVSQALSVKADFEEASDESR